MQEVWPSKKELAAHLRSQHAEYVKALLEVKAQKERKVVDKREDGTLPTIVTSLRCDQCHFGSMDDNDLKKHKKIHHKVKGTTRAGTFSSSEVWGVQIYMSSGGSAVSATDTQLAGGDPGEPAWGRDPILL